MTGRYILLVLISIVIFHGSLRAQQPGTKSSAFKSALFKTDDPAGSSKSIQTIPGTGKVRKGQKPVTSGFGNILNSNTTPSPEHRSCFTVESEKILQEKFANRLSKEQFEEKLSSRLVASTRLFGPQTVYKIPTIVHVVNYGEPIGTGTNISQEQVMSQFEALNEDFRRLGNGYNEHPSGADIFIEFVPAVEDQQGIALREPGINRIFGYSAYYEYANIEQELKPNTQWDPDRYFNIWVVNFGGGLSTTLGYAQFPTMSGLEGLPENDFAPTDGVVIGYKYFGRTENVKAPFNLGRTTTHEVGHWLGLRHIWGDGDCSVDDYCMDTPNADGPNQTCTIRDSCPEEGSDMIENYMDYSDDGCMNVFTQDQRMRMRTVLEFSPRRNSLIACQVGDPAVEGKNIAGGRKWFEYTAPAREVVTVSSIGSTSVNTKVSFYHGCNTLPVNVSDNAFNSEQSELTVALNAGETIKILWEGIESVEEFEWTLTAMAPASGASCEVAAKAVEGSIHTPVTNLNRFWFKYTASSANEKVTIDGGQHSFDIFLNSCSNLQKIGEGQLTKTVYGVAQGESIYIAFNAEGGNFDWTMKSEVSRKGETCTDVVAAQEGSNVIPYAGPFQYWQEYTMPYEGTITILSADRSASSPHVAIYKACDDRPFIQSANLNDEPLTIPLSQGETVKIAWEAEIMSKGFEWLLQPTAYTNGEVCSVAKVANQGMNTAGFAPQWFSYTTTKKSNLKISSVGFSEVDTHLIIKRTCDGAIEYDNDNSSAPSYSPQAELILYGVEAGETIFILWSEKWSYEGFDWNIEEVEMLPGDNCANAKVAVEGTNTVDYNNGHINFGDIFWTKFTVPAAGKKITAFSSIPVDVAVYTAENCDNFKWLTENQGKVEVFDLPAGQEILIIWDGSAYSADFTWELSVEPIERGDMCTTAITAVEGVNESDYTIVWYEYTMKHRGSLKFSAVGLMDRHAMFTVYDGCDGNVLYSNSTEYTNLPPEALIVGLNRGERVVIQWTTGYPFTGVKFALEEVSIKDGDLCSKPLTASYGLNQAKYATQWYSYTAEKSGTLKISSRAYTTNDTDLYIYDACEGKLLAHNDDIVVMEEGVFYFQSEAVLENVEAGQTFLIKWAGTWSIYPFTWEISDDQPRQGDSCEDPLTAIEGVNNAMKPNPSWFTFTMPRTTSLTISSLGYTDFTSTVEIYDACNGNLLAADDFTDMSSQTYLHLPELHEGQTILIKCFNTPWAPSERYTYDWRLILGQPEPGLFCQVPDVAAIGTNVTPPYISEMYWYSFTMPEDNKKLVIKRKSTPGQYQRVVGVMSSCDWNTATHYGKGIDEVEVSGLPAGEQVLIYWGNSMVGERPSNEWTLELEDLGSGDNCENAKEALPGVNAYAGPPTWYRFSMAKAGNLRISSMGLTEGRNTYVEVFDGCNGNLIASNDNPEDYSTFESEVFLENLEAGQTVLIKWSLVYLDQLPFQWRLTVEGAENEAPLLADAFFEMPANDDEDKLLGILTAEDPDDDELRYWITEGNEDSAFMLNASSGELKLADATKVPEDDISRVLKVSVTDLVEVTSATITISIVTSIDSENSGTVRAYPNPVRNNLVLHIPSHITLLESTLTDMNGRPILNHRATQKELSLGSVKSGVYYLKLRTSAGSQVIKLIKID